MGTADVVPVCVADIHSAPLSVASASIGFARYASYLHPLTNGKRRQFQAGLVLLLIVLPLPAITTIGKISVLLWAGVIGTMLWLIWGGVTHFDKKVAFDFPAGAFSFSSLWFAGLGAAMVNTVYSYWGYYNICHLGGEIKEPEKTFRGDFSVGAGNCGAVLADAIEHSGRGAVARGAGFEIPGEFVCGAVVRARRAQVVTCMVLWIALASVFSVLLGYSRVPYSAALDGNFLSVFAKVHPDEAFPM